MNTLEHFKTLNNPPHYQFESIPCYLCGEKENELFLVGQEDLTGKEGYFQYVTCRQCGLTYQNPRIALHQIKEFYDQEYIAHRKKKDWGFLTPLYERAMNKHDRDKTKLVTQYITLHSDSRVLDVGCAVGTFLLHLKDQYHCSISGVDFKEGLSFPRFEEIDFHLGLFYEQKNIPEQSFDLITMWHFLEHCYDPKKSLEKAYSLLNKTGRLVIEVPRLDSFSYSLFKHKWPGVQAPQHTILFDKKHFLQIVQQSGFKVFQYLPYGAFPPYFYLFAGTYFKLFGKGLPLDKIVAPYFAGQFLLSPFLMFQKKLNLAMQTIICGRE